MTLVRSLLCAALCFLTVGCGDAVLNPALEGFDSDPRVITGDWVTVHTRANAEPLLLDGEIVAAGGVLIGSFDFHRLGDFWHIEFNDATWDGTRARFVVPMTINQTNTMVAWTATFIPRRDGEPAHLLLASDPFGGTDSPIQYLRPRDVEGP